MKNKNQYLELASQLLNMLTPHSNPLQLNSVYFQTVTLLKSLYGQQDLRIKGLLDYKLKTFDQYPSFQDEREKFSDYLRGILDGVRSDIQNDLAGDLRKEATGLVIADFLSIAKTAIEEGHKDVGAVLATAALEDSLKRFAAFNNLNVDDKEMSEVINALKSKGLLKGPQAGIVQSYVPLRNKVFHAEWSKFELPDVKSLIVFTEEFILQNLS